LCYSPFHGESADRDASLAECVRVLLDAGANPDARDGRYGIPALYAVTGERSVPRIARLLLEAGAPPNDGESLFHAAEHCHDDALELLHEFGADANFVGEWGNTPLYFLLLWHDLEQEGDVRRGFLWLLDHGADPNVPSGPDRESALHAAVRRGQSPRITRLLLDRGADVHARRADGRTPWMLAARSGGDELKALLEEHGARPEPLSSLDELLAACSRGDEDAARRRTTPELVASLEPADRRVVVEAARKGRGDVVRAFLAAGLPVDTRDEQDATALHHACIGGHAGLVAELLRQGADFRLRDREHRATPLDWATFGADVIREPGGDYPGCVRALLEVGARPAAGDHPPRDGAVREVLARFGVA
jgi:ankyrin repeat protein